MMRSVVLLMVAIAAPAAAADYPARPIHIIVGFAAGGGNDIIARVFGQKLSEDLGQPVIVENTTGAGGTIGVGRVARAAPDGYTIGIGQWGTNVASGAIYPLQFDLVKDFEPVALIATQPFLIVAKKTIPANNLGELISWLKANALVTQIWGVAKELKVGMFQEDFGDAVLDDHIALQEGGIPAIDIIDFSYEHWHKLSDTPENCSGESMGQVARVLSVWVQRVK